MKKQAGFGILELLVIVSIILAGFVSIASLNQQMLRLQSQNAELIELQIYARGLVAMVTDNTVWSTKVRPANAAAMACLTTTCSLSAGGYAHYNATGALIAGQERPLIIPNATVGVLFDPTNPDNGITLTGVKCGPHADSPAMRALAYPSNECPATFKINWYPTTVKAEPLLAITIRLIVHPDFARMTIDTTRFSFDNGPGQPANAPPIINRSSL